MARKPKSSESTSEIAQEVIEEQAPVLEKLAQSDTTNYTASAYGLFKDPNNGEWVVTEIDYDPVTLKVKNEVKLIPSGDNSKAVGMERFKITVGRHLMGKL